MKIFEIISSLNLDGIIYENVIDSHCYIKDQNGRRHVVAIKYYRLPKSVNTIYRVEGEETKYQYPLSYTDNLIIEDVINILYSSTLGFQRNHYRFRELNLF